MSDEGRPKRERKVSSKIGFMESKHPIHPSHRNCSDRHCARAFVSGKLVSETNALFVSENGKEWEETAKKQSTKRKSGVHPF